MLVVQVQVFAEDKASHLLLLGAKLSDGTDNAQAPGSQSKHASAVYLLITTVRFFHISASEYICYLDV